MANPPYHHLLLIFYLFTSHLLIAAAAPPLRRSLQVGALSSKRHAREFLSAHNEVRSYVGEAPYVWNRKLALYARRWANQRRGDCQCVHSEGPYGENMFWGTGQEWRAADAVRSWAEEHSDYDPENNSCRPGRMCGHYTQIVWNATVALGCALVVCDGGGVIVVCNYDPPGNFLGESPFQIVI